MKQSLHFLACLFVLLAVNLPGPVAAEPMFETLDAGPMPAVTTPKPVPVDWRRDASTGGILAQIQTLARSRLRTASTELQLRRLRASLRPMLSPPENEMAARRAYEQTLSVRRHSRLLHGKQRAGAFSIQSLRDPAPVKEFLQVKATHVYLGT